MTRSAECVANILRPGVYMVFGQFHERHELERDDLEVEVAVDDTGAIWIWFRLFDKTETHRLFTAKEVYRGAWRPVGELHRRLDPLLARAA